MAREEVPVSPDQIPAEVRDYMAALQQCHDHPFVQHYFHQVTWLSVSVPDHGQVDFYALEFRMGIRAAMIWQDGEGNWGTGGWITLSHPDADITRPPSPLSLNYFQEVAGSPSLGAALDLLAASKSEDTEIGT